MRRTPTLCPLRFRTLLALLALLTAGCAGGIRAPVTPDASSSTLFAAVIDAGSSGSRIYVYRWRPGGAAALPWVEPLWEMKVEPGLSEFADRPEEVAANLRPLIEFAVERIGGERRMLGRYPLHLKATGGVRLLSPQAQRRVLDAAAEYLESTPFAAGPPEVISGQQEGIFGWISVNYLLGYLDDGGPFPSAGALDLGGASTQITFVPLDAPPENLVRLKIGDSLFPLYTHSYLGLGQDEARLAVDSPACYPRGYPIPEGGVGEGDYGRCREAVLAYLDRPCEAQRCSLMGVYQPPVYGEYFLFSAFTFAADFFGLGQTFSLDRLEKEGREYCARSWEEIGRTRAADLGDPYLPRNCFTAVYLVALLDDGYGFAPDDRRLLVPSRLQNQEVGWTLGALLWELTGASLE